MLMNARNQPVYLILQAWNIELGRARTLAALNSPSIVAGKFAFWRDVVAGQRTEHPIATGLQQLIRQYDWPADLLTNILAAKVQIWRPFPDLNSKQEKDCSRWHFKDMDELRSHYAMSEGIINELLLRSVLPSPSEIHVEAARRIGVASGVTRLLRTAIKSRTSGIDPGFPMDILHRHGFRPNDLVDSKRWLKGSLLAPVIQELALTATGELENGTRQLRGTREASELFLYTV